MKKIIIPLLALALLCAIPASATITVTAVTSSAGDISSGASTTIPSTAAGDTVAVLMQMEGTGAGTNTSCTDSGDTFNVAFAGTNLTATTRTGGVCYVLNGAGGKTSIVVNFTGAAGVVYTVYQIHTTVGAPLVADVSNSTNLIGSTSTPVGPSVTTTGPNDIILALLVENVQDATGNLLNTGVTFTLDANPSGAFGRPGMSSLRNVGPGTYAPKWQMSGSDISASIVLSFSEPQLGGTTIVKSFPESGRCNFVFGFIPRRKRECEELV